MGDPSWAQDERFSTALGRYGHADELDRFVESWTSKHTEEEIMDRLQSSGVPAGIVQTGADLVNRDPQIREHGFFRQVPDGQGAMTPIEGPPYRLSLTPGGPLRAAPGFGAQQTYVLRDILGISDEELAQCAIEEVFE
jgi:crotonobetainyl-CoA:carnitine CoA-transferase CaiB-like acyl-CoA transferase